MAKNGKKSFLDFFKVDESSDEYEDDLFEDDVKPITPPTPQAQPKAVENVKKQEYKSLQM